MKFIYIFTLIFSFFIRPFDLNTSENHSSSDQLASHPPMLRVSFAGQEWRYDLTQAGFDGMDPTTIDQKEVRRWFQQVVVKQIDRVPRSASYQDGQMVAHQWGRKVDLSRLEAFLHPLVFYRYYPQHPIPLPVRWLKPALTLEKLKTLSEKELGSYSTCFNPTIRNRSHNIYLSARALDHRVVMPGEIFSFNQTVGRRTLERGYLPARIIVKGEYSEGIGGGICQTSSTLYNSVDAAGLRIVRRVSHSKQVPYVPENRDATVSWGGPDFRFQNQLNEPILLVSSIKDGVLNISVYGPKKIRHQKRAVPPSPQAPMEHTS